MRWLVEAYERLAMPDSAASVFESIVSPRGLPGQQLTIRGIPYSFAHQRLVILYARLGRFDDARRHWKIFSETFTTPDPELRHFIDEAREALLASPRNSLKP